MFDPDEPRRLKELRDREITLEVEQPLPFWAAIDQLCSAGALRLCGITRPGVRDR